MRNFTRLVGVEGVLSGGIAVANVQTNRRIFNHKIHATGKKKDGSVATASEIVESVKVIVNSQEMRNLTPAEILEIAYRNNKDVPSDVLPLFYAEPWRASVIGEELPSFDLAGQKKATLEIKLREDISDLRLWVKECYDFGRNVQFKNNRAEPILAIIKQLPMVWNAPGGQFDLSGIQTRYPIQRIILTPSVGAVTDVEVTRDGEKVIELTAAENEEILSDYHQRVKPGTFPIVFDSEQQISSALRVTQNMNVRVTLSAPCTLRGIVEYTAPGYV